MTTPTSLPFFHRIVVPFLLLVSLGTNAWMFRRFEGANGRNAGAVVEAQGKLNGRANEIEKSVAALKKTVEGLTPTPGSGAGLDEETRQRMLYVFDYLGQLDLDADKAIGFEDLCPDIVGEFTGCPTDPTLDPDGDGVGLRDQCPTSPTGSTVIHALEGKKYTWGKFQKANPWEGCADADADGIGDPGDKCPDTKPGEFHTNANGCKAYQLLERCDNGTPASVPGDPTKATLASCGGAEPGEVLTCTYGGEPATYSNCTSSLEPG